MTNHSNSGPSPGRSIARRLQFPGIDQTIQKRKFDGIDMDRFPVGPEIFDSKAMGGQHLGYNVDWSLYRFSGAIECMDHHVQWPVTESAIKRLHKNHESMLRMGSGQCALLWVHGRSINRD
jgi:hypothetical protein